MMSDIENHKFAKTESEEGMFRICLMGAPFDTNNRGVSALASSLVKLVTEILPHAKISFFMGNPDKQNKTLPLAGKDVAVDVINYRFSPRARLQEHLLFLLLLAILVYVAPLNWLKKKIIRRNSRLSELAECDIIGDIHGGDSFSDIYGLGQYIIGIIPAIIIILLGKKLILLPQTYGPYNSRLAKAIARWVIQRSFAVLSRDRDCTLLINDLLRRRGRNVPIEFCPDVAFTLPAIIPSKIEIYPPTYFPPEEAFIGINVNGLMYNGGYSGKNMFRLNFEYKTFILSLVERLLSETTHRIFLIPHTYGIKGNVNSDNEAAMEVYETLKNKCSNKLYLVTGEYNQFEIKGIIGCCDFFIGSRMHACIAAISQAVPTTAVAYSKKFGGLFGSVGLGHMVVDARTLDSNEAINRVVELYRNREVERMSMEQKIDFSRTQVYETFEKLLSKTSLDKGAV